MTTAAPFGVGDPLGVRFGEDCHWCRPELWDVNPLMHQSLGLRYDLPQRYVQILRRTRSQAEMPKGEDGRRTADTVPRMGVQPNWPLRLWWNAAERYDPELIASLPPYDELACPRCLGTGKRKD